MQLTPLVDCWLSSLASDLAPCARCQAQARRPSVVTTAGGQGDFELDRQPEPVIAPIGSEVPLVLNLAEQLQQITEFHRVGALSDDDFVCAKARLLSG